MLKGLGNLANLGSILKQAQQMGSKLQELSEELKKERATGTAGGGLVEAEVNGAGELLAVRIEPSIFDSGDRELIEDLIPAAVNQALAKAKEIHAEKMKELTGGLDIQGLQGALGNLGGGQEPDQET